MTSIWQHINLDRLARFLHSKVTLFLLIYFLEASYLSLVHTWGRGSIYIHDLEFFCKIRVFLDLFIHISSNPILYFYFVGHIFAALTSQVGTYPYTFGFWALPSFLTLEGAPGSSYIFFALVVESAISPRHRDSFYWRMSVLIVIEVPLLSGLLKGHSLVLSVCMYTTHVYPGICNCFCIHLCMHMY